MNPCPPLRIPRNSRPAAMAACWSSLPICHASRPTVKTIARQWKRPWMPWDPIFRSACRAGKRFRCPHLPSAVSDWCPCRFGWRRNWRVRLLARKDRKEKRQVGVVRVQQIQLAEVQRIVARYGGEIGVQLVISLRKKIAVRVGEDASKLGYKLIEFRS